MLKFPILYCNFFLLNNHISFKGLKRQEEIHIYICIQVQTYRYILLYSLLYFMYIVFYIYSLFQPFPVFFFIPYCRSESLLCVISFQAEEPIAFLVQICWQQIFFVSIYLKNMGSSGHSPFSMIYSLLSHIPLFRSKP